ncbi:hypothetical protein ACTYEO_04300 [Rhodophyticola sp. SM2404]
MQMFLTLIAVFIAGLGGAGIALALRKLTRLNLPGWITPVAVGGSMLFATVSMEYSWAGATLDAMPEDTIVVSERLQQTWWQPWTFVRPWTKGFIAFSPSETRETAENSGILVVQTQFRERWQPGLVKPVLVDCAGLRRAEILPETVFDEAGQPTNADWRDVDSDDGFLAPVCEGQ